MKRRRQDRADHKPVKAIGLCLIAILATTGVVLLAHHKRTVNSTTSMSPVSTQQTVGASPPNQTNINSYQGWNTYTSSGEKASFKYPANWAISKAVTASNDAGNTDQTGVTSPSGAITISWVTGL